MASLDEKTGQVLGWIGIVTLIAAPIFVLFVVPKLREEVESEEP